MTGGKSETTAGRGLPDPSWADARLVSECLQGSETAWCALVDKYKRLVYAVVHRYGPPADEAADLFQAIWLDVHHDLHQLKKHGAIRGWLVSLASRKCYRWKIRQRRREFHESADTDLEQLGERAILEPSFVAELENQQLVRNAIAKLPARCRELIHLLFFTTPPKPYREVAEQLGLATGSIGFIRGRCLTRLRKMLEKHGAK